MEEFTIHVVQNAEIEQALCSKSGFKDSTEFSHIAPLYAVLIFPGPKLDPGVPKSVCIRHVVKEGAVVYFSLLGRRPCNKCDTLR